MGKTYKDRPEKYQDRFKYKRIKDKPFKSSKGRAKANYKNLEGEDNGRLYDCYVHILCHS